MKYYSIDRIEGTKAVLMGDDGDSIIIEAEFFDQPPKEGNVVEQKDGFFVFDSVETQRRRGIAVERLKMLLKRSETPKVNEE